MNEQILEEQADAEALAPNDGLTQDEEATAEDKQRVRAAVVYEIIRLEGEEELSRKFHALWWSGIAAGLCIGFSFLSEAWLAATLPDASWRPLIDNMGYTVGFLMVIMGHMQLFTENTLTAVLPVVARMRWKWVGVLLRLWGIVLAANLVGCLLFAVYFSIPGIVSNDVHASMMNIAHHLMANDVSQMFLRGIVAGWIIAVLVWILPTAEGSKFAIIFLLTYLIALGDLTHVIAGSAEAMFVWINGDTSLFDVVFRFFLPTLLGNVFGGTLLFATVIYAQVHEEIKGDAPL
ncbi:MAG: formate/nitrite transporter family protein [Hyphomicrobiaceae bacterium]